jgi:hypothetical protein
MKRSPSNALFGISCLFILLVWGLSSCSKGGSSGGGGGNSSGNGTGVDAATGPANIWLGQTSNIDGGDTTITEIQLSSSHAIAKVITYAYIAGDTSYGVTIPVYTNGKLTALEVSTDTTASSGTVYAQFTYGSSWIKVQYGSASLYDSVVTFDNHVSSVYRYEPAGATQKPTLFQDEVLTWNSQGDISSMVINSIDTTSGAVLALTSDYTYDGSYNPYRTLSDAAFILGSAIDGNVLMLTANNVSTAQVTGYNSSNSYLYQYNAQSLPTSQNFEYLQQGAVKSSSLTYFQYIAQN